MDTIDMLLDAYEVLPPELQELVEPGMWEALIGWRPSFGERNND